nr:protein ANTAGONIST OF LIKE HETEROCHROMATIN PROTEIN 1-like [Onthophagus taurus]
MSIASFHELNHKLKDVLQRQDTVMRDCIEPMQMLAVAIRYLASGCTFTDLHYTYRLGLTTISNIVRDVCLAIWNVLRLECLPEPTKQKWEGIASTFEKRANFPNCLGAVDGKHVRIVNPVGSMYYNYKGYSSVVLMAVADSDYRFIYVNVGSYGKDCDSSIFKNCSLWKSILNGEQEVPEAKFLPGMTNKEVPYCFVGDEAFALHQHFLRPFGGHNLTITKRIFNYRLSRARRYVECTFGILSNKWRIFHRAINLKPDFAVNIVKACVVLHNFVRERDGYKIEDTFTVTGLAELPGATVVRGRTKANDIRNIYADYFMSEVGSVSWQMSKI